MTTNDDERAAWEKIREHGSRLSFHEDDNVSDAGAVIENIARDRLQARAAQAAPVVVGLEALYDLLWGEYRDGAGGPFAFECMALKVVEHFRALGAPIEIQDQESPGAVSPASESVAEGVQDAADPADREDGSPAPGSPLSRVVEAAKKQLGMKWGPEHFYSMEAAGGFTFEQRELYEALRDLYESTSAVSDDPGTPIETAVGDDRGGAGSSTRTDADREAAIQAVCWERGSHLTDRVAQAIAAARAEEREECANTCIDRAAHHRDEIAREQAREHELKISREEVIENLEQANCEAHQCAYEIRARGTEGGEG